MAIAKRLFLFVLTNILVMVTISFVMNLLGIGSYITRRGIDLNALMGFCLIWGFAGAFISLALSRIMAKWTLGVQLVDPQVSDSNLKWLLDTVHRLSKDAGIRVAPQVGVYESPELNAFATGPTKNRSLVAVSSGLLYRMDRNQIEGVLGHEVAHIANGDMVTMTLVQGVVNAFVMFFARVIAYAISQTVQKEEMRPMVHMISVIVLEIALSFLGMIIVAAFSRHREYRADRGGAALTSREKMVAALEALRRNFEPQSQDQQASVATLKISGKSRGLLNLFSTHPPLEERIQRLNTAT